MYTFVVFLLYIMRYVNAYQPSIGQRDFFLAYDGYMVAFGQVRAYIEKYTHPYTSDVPETNDVNSPLFRKCKTVKKKGLHFLMISPTSFIF